MAFHVSEKFEVGLSRGTISARNRPTRESCGFGRGGFRLGSLNFRLLLPCGDCTNGLKCGCGNSSDLI